MLDRSPPVVWLECPPPPPPPPPLPQVTVIVVAIMAARGITCPIAIPYQWTVAICWCTAFVIMMYHNFRSITLHRKWCNDSASIWIVITVWIYSDVVHTIRGTRISQFGHNHADEDWKVHTHLHCLILIIALNNLGDDETFGGHAKVCYFELFCELYICFHWRYTLC